MSYLLIVCGRPFKNRNGTEIGQTIYCITKEQGALLLLLSHVLSGWTEGPFIKEVTDFRGIFTPTPWGDLSTHVIINMES